MEWEREDGPTGKLMQEIRETHSRGTHAMGWGFLSRKLKDLRQKSPSNVSVIRSSPGSDPFQLSLPIKNLSLSRTTVSSFIASNGDSRSLIKNSIY